VASLAGIGTILLATATFLSLWLNEAELDAIRKERDRPLAIDELANFIDPSITILQSDIERMSDNSIQAMDWHYIDWPAYPGGTRSPSSLLHRIKGHLDYVALVRFQESSPENWKIVLEREQLIEEGIELSKSVSGEVKPTIREYIIENDIKNNEGSIPNIDTIMTSTFQQIESYGEQSSDYDVWEEHRGTFIEILLNNAEEEYQELLDIEGEILELSRELLEELEGRRAELRLEYGISNSSISEQDGNDWV
jgi:hypothetical protein